MKFFNAAAEFDKFTASEVHLEAFTHFQNAVQNRLQV